MSIRRAALVVAAGSGTRAGFKKPKQFMPLVGKPLLQHTVDALSAYDFDVLVLVRPPQGFEYQTIDLSGFRESVVVPGGATRTDSVRQGLAMIDRLNVDRVFIHDGARPFVDVALLARLDVGLESRDGVVPALPMVDAVKACSNGYLGGDVPRDNMRRVQTPQAFSFLPIYTAYQSTSGAQSDCAAVAQASGMMVGMVEGNEDNFKVTYPADFDRAERILKTRAAS